MSTPDLSTARWFKSSRSTNNGTCVEAAFLWRKSSRSANNGECVEVATLPDQVALRDSKDPTGPVLVFPVDAWAAFVADVKSGGYDLR
jgi:hypothetical protein